jgi:hypothetical protein
LARSVKKIKFLYQSPLTVKLIIMEERVQAPGNKQDLYAQVSKRTGVAEADVKKIMEALGVDKHFDEASRLLGATPNVGNIIIGFRVSPSTVSV